MKSILWLFLITVCFCSLSAQDTTPTEKTAAKKFGQIPDERGWDAKHMDEYLTEYFDLADRYRNSQAVVILHGTFDQIVERRNVVVRKAFSRNFGSIRLRFVVVKSDTDTPTDFWVVPANAIAPSVESEAWVGFSLGEVINSKSQKELKDFLVKAFDLRGEVQYYIINYGPPSFVARRERFFRDALYRTPEFPDPRITFVNGGATQPSSTHIWLVPNGAKLPVP